MNLRTNPFYLNGKEEKWVFDTLRSLTLKEKVGQLFCVLGTIYSDEELSKLVSEYNIGSVLFRPDPTEKLIERYKVIDKVAKIPLLKAANLEEGGVGAVSDGTYFGWPMQIAATGDVECARDFARVCAEEGGATGVNWTFSPVCDLDLNFRNPITNVRTFGSDTDSVERMVSAYVEEIQKQGVAACAKHFPGDGHDFRDQHLHATINGLSADEWHASYGRIYRTLIAKGLMSVMVGHIKQPAVEMEVDPSLTYEKCLPASLSKPLMTGVLREKYGFNGVITTDATIMAGYTQAMKRADAIPTTIAAGADMLVFSTNIYEDTDFMLDGIKRGIVTEERIDEAVTRILALKAVNMRGVKPEAVKDKAAVTKSCSDKAVTLVKNIADIMPVTPEKYPKIRLITLGNDFAEGERISDFATLELGKRGFIVEKYVREDDDMHGVGCLDSKRLTLYLANEETASNRTTVRLDWNPKHAMDTPRHVFEEDSVFVSLYNPYHLQDVPAVKAYINAYSPTKANILSVIAKICGESEFKGKSPVDAFCGLLDTRY